MYSAGLLNIEYRITQYPKKASVLILLLGFILVPNVAIATNVDCPSTIATQQSLNNKVAGWEDFIDDLNSTHDFNRVTFYSGHPKMHASLVPDNERSKNATWFFGHGTIWMACGYSNTDVQLIQQIPRSIKSCTVTYPANSSDKMLIKCI